MEYSTPIGGGLLAQGGGGAGYGGLLNALIKHYGQNMAAQIPAMAQPQDNHASDRELAQMLGLIPADPRAQPMALLPYEGGDPRQQAVMASR